MTTATSGPAWPDGPMLALDLETTGIDPETARIVSAATVPIGASSTPPACTWLVDPGIEIPAVHGITTDQAANHGRPAAEVIPEAA